MSLTKTEVDWLVRIEGKIDKIASNGCARSEQHANHDERLRAVERLQSEGRGRAAVIGAIVAMIMSAFFAWVGRNV